MLRGDIQQDQASNMPIWNARASPSIAGQTPPALPATTDDARRSEFGHGKDAGGPRQSIKQTIEPAQS
jgi:hypothetical protein